MPTAVVVIPGSPLPRVLSMDGWVVIENQVGKVKCRSCNHLVNLLEMSECLTCGMMFCGKGSNSCRAICECD